MEMIQRGERPDDIQDINDDPPNPDQPISEPRMAPKPKPWEKQDQESLAWDLKSPSSVSSDLKSEVQHNSTNKAMESASVSRDLKSEVQHDSTNKAVESADGPNHGDSLQAEVAAGSESLTDDAASLK